MISCNLGQLADALNAKLCLSNGDSDLITIESVSTDTRNIKDNGLFIALIGERFDAHDFVQQAIDNGAKALLVERELAVQVPQLVVGDTKLALGQLGAWVHAQCNTPTVAITGSCGKTTVKEMVAAILSQKGQVLFTNGNFNNDIGVPLTLLRSTPEDDYAVIEMGANHIGEIAYTTQLAKPDVAVVNNVAAAHLEGFGSIDGVKQAKGEIYQGLSSGETAIVNLDSQGDAYWQQVLADKKVVTFALENTQADIFASNIKLSSAGYASFTLNAFGNQLRVQLGIVGGHNVSNALSACALALSMGADLEEVASGLSQVANVKGRVEVKSLTDSITLIDDSYNASVPAMLAAVDLLGEFKGQRWLVLGNMAELGKESLALHQQVGEHAAPFKFEHVLTYGNDAKVISQVNNGKHFTSHDEMTMYIEQLLSSSADETHTILVKGANSAGMFKIANALKENFS
ncbi:UDP-N-acetylmuramoyl-tripeptide--D-alanyl-D-alanine ligase [Vibrio maerlii]|uniref:UDP-N-acetylmuramoyl-tripeptide--D-alanyl-D- alanine ligase n=1 Tax=Vibrio maerlii TaxID=2231648 RepID=UPI000E3BF21E|nr:UDP-N-acetylmuramoyl-tripeptide--D-alanyl-D-alanine ligase [Vibrio maerlii]